MDLPPSLIGALDYEHARAREREMDLTNSVRYHLQRLLYGWYETVGDYFQRIMYPFTDPTSKQSVWDAVTAKQVGTEPVLLDALDETLASLTGEVEDLGDETAEEQDRHGFLLGLWLLASQGESHFTYTVPPFALAAVFGGLTYRDRFGQWRDGYRQRAAQILRAQIRIGGTLADTTAPLRTLGTGFEARTTSLLSDEMYGQLIAGQVRAVTPYGPLAHLWLTRDDEKVCPICWPLHKTITTLQPITDTHPRCRCVIIPIRSAAAFTTLGFDAFAGLFT